MKNIGNITIFSDGSSRGNPGPGGWGAIIMQKSKIKNQKDESYVIELGGVEKHTTNNRMELLGAINALKEVQSRKSKVESQFDWVEIVVNTDSSYVINGITKWVYGWQKNGWKSSTKEDVVNRDLWEKLIEVAGINPSQIKSQFDGARIKWNYVGGHIGVPGNERCDVIATSFADGEKIELFKGKLSDYGHDLEDTKGSAVKTKKKSSNKGKAYSYLSLVHGILKIDKTWAECEKRVNGVKGDVKFKKAMSLEEEKEIIKEWLGKTKI